jgi:hypothetical protein
MPLNHQQRHLDQKLGIALEHLEGILCILSVYLLFHGKALSECLPCQLRYPTTGWINDKRMSLANMFQFSWCRCSLWPKVEQQVFYHCCDQWWSVRGVEGLVVKAQFLCHGKKAVSCHDHLQEEWVGDDLMTLWEMTMTSLVTYLNTNNRKNWTQDSRQNSLHRSP